MFTSKVMHDCVHDLLLMMLLHCSLGFCIKKKITSETYINLKVSLGE